MRELLASQQLPLAVAIAAAQVGEGLTAAVGDQLPRSRETVPGETAGGVRDVVRYEVHGGRIQPRQRGSQELGCLERHRPFAVFAAAEPFLLRGGHDFPVDDQRCGGIVKNRVDTEDAHANTPRFR